MTYNLLLSVIKWHHLVNCEYLDAAVVTNDNYGNSQSASMTMAAGRSGEALER
jgi:hypothetical protein